MFADLTCSFVDSISHSFILIYAPFVYLSRSKSVNLDGSINNPSMHGNFTNIPIEMGSEWMYADTEAEGEYE